jgi:uncharacterized membrane protein
LDKLTSYLVVTVLSMTPVVEVNGSIPVALAVYNLSPLEALLCAFLGAIIVIVTVMSLLAVVVKWIRTWHPKIDAWIEWFFTKTHRKHTADFEKWGNLFLFIFVAIPGPLTGVWMASLLAYLFGIRLKNAIVSIGLGALLAALLMIAITMGGISLLRL